MLDYTYLATYIVLMSIAGLLFGIVYGLIINYYKRKRRKNK